MLPLCGKPFFSCSVSSGLPLYIHLLLVRAATNMSDKTSLRHAFWQLSWTLFAATAVTWYCRHWYMVLLHWLLLLLICEVYATYVQVEQLLRTQSKHEAVLMELRHSRTDATVKLMEERLRHRHQLQDSENTTMRLRLELQRRIAREGFLRTQSMSSPEVLLHKSLGSQSLGSQSMSSPELLLHQSLGSQSLPKLSL